jgi:hypothetical protein
MVRLRLTIANSGDRTEEIRYAARLRQAIWGRLPVEVDPDNPLHGTHCDESGRAYFEFATNTPDEVRGVLREWDPQGRVTVTEPRGPQGQACENCGNIAGPVLPPICPACGFRDISPCPICNRPVPRDAYARENGDVFICPSCRNRVRLRFHSPLFKPDGSYNEPLVVVDAALPPHEVR